jgi:ABC-type uncharacterized transport system substrate-binding protein
MLTALTTILGAITGVIPSIVNIFEKRQDYKHQVEIEKIKMEAAEKGVSLQIALAESKASIEEGDSLRRHDSDIEYHGWVETLRATVRPLITYIFFMMFVIIKGSAAYVMMQNGADIPTMLTAVWDMETMAIFGSIMGFWFGSRSIEKYMSARKS